MRLTRGRAALLTFLLVATAACTRDETSSGTDDTTTTEASSGSDEATALENGGFGDLPAVCAEGDASGATATGVTDTEIRVGTITDKGFVGSQGVNKEMYDAAVAFAGWCNDHGGILGRQLVVDDLDAALTEYEPRITEACDQDLALVGGGAVFDEDPNDVRVGCGLANIPGFVVSERGRTADLQVQPVPNPVAKNSLGRYVTAKRDFPDGIGHYAIMAANVPSVLLVRDQIVSAAESLGYTVDYSVVTAPQGETGWANFVSDMEAKDIKMLEFVGPPSDLAQLDLAMDTAEWQPDVILEGGNIYDSSYAEVAKDVAGNLYIQTQYHPFELAEDNKATQDYLDVMKQYNPSGKVALLGAQSMSAYLLFASAAAECGSDLTQACLLEKAAAHADWTAGGLHAKQTPGNDTPSPCNLLLGLGPDGFIYNEEATRPTDGVYNCDPGNILTFSGG